MRQDAETYVFIIIAMVIGFLLVGFILAMVFLSRRRQERQELEIERMKDNYEREALRSQLEIQENTLKTISQELHDNIGQMLSVVKLSLSALPIEKDHPSKDMLVNSQQVLNKAILDLSNLTKSLHADRIADIGLVDSIRFELLSVKNAGLVNTQLKVSGLEEPLPEQKSVFLFRIFQEILNNTLKHAQARNIQVNLEFAQEHQFRMMIKDDGVGFNVEEKKRSAEAGKGVGLKSLFNRAQLIGAELNIDSGPGKGTVSTIELTA